MFNPPTFDETFPPALLDMSHTPALYSPKKSHYRCLLQRMGQHMPWKSGILCCLYYCILSPLSALKTLSAGPWPTPETSSNGNRSAVTSSQSELTFYSDSLTFYSDSFKSNVSVHDPLVTRHSLFGCLAHSVVGTSKDLGWWNTRFIPHHLPAMCLQARTDRHTAVIPHESWGRY